MFRIVAAPVDCRWRCRPGGELEVSVVFDPPADTPLGHQDRRPAHQRRRRDAVAARAVAPRARDRGRGRRDEPSLQRVFDLLRAADRRSATPTRPPATCPCRWPTPNDAVEIEALVKAGTGPVRDRGDVGVRLRRQPDDPLRLLQPDQRRADGSADRHRVAAHRPPLTQRQHELRPRHRGVRPLHAAPARSARPRTPSRTSNTFEPDRRHRAQGAVLPARRHRTASRWPTRSSWRSRRWPGSYDYQDFVAIIRNVRAADVPPPQPELTVLVDGGERRQRRDGRFRPSVTEGDRRPERTITVRNDGNVDLAIGAVTLPAGLRAGAGAVARRRCRRAQSDTIRVALSTATPARSTGRRRSPATTPTRARSRLKLTGNVGRDAAGPARRRPEDRPRRRRARRR